MPETITIYGDRTCEDTAAILERLDVLSIQYRMVFIEDHKPAELFVKFINGGDRSTPTIVFGEGKRKMVLTEPDIDTLDDTLRWAGYTD